VKPWILVIALALTGAVIAIWWDVRSVESPAIATPAAAPAPPRSAARAPAAMAPSHVRPAIAAGDTATGAAGAGSAEPPTRADAAPTGEEVRDHLELSFAADRAASASPGLTYGVEQGVRAALPAGSSVRSVECRSALCRVETVHASPEDFREFVRRAFQTPDSKVANHPVFAGLVAGSAPGEPVVAVVYLGREGTMLPMPPSVAVSDRPR
jgi:hypothetical protein